MRPKFEPEWRTPLGIQVPHPRSFSFGGPGPANQHPTLVPTLPLTIMSISSSPSPTPTTSHTPTPSPSSLSLSSLNWNFEPVSNPITCTNVNISWTFFNNQSDIDAIFASTSTVDFTITISGFGSSNVSIPLKFEGSAEQVLGGPKSVSWLANAPPGFYDVNGIVTANVEPGDSPSDNASPSIETSFRLLQGPDTSCIPSQSSSFGSSPDSQTGAQPHSHSSSNAGAIAGGVVGGFVALGLLTAGLLLFFRRKRQHNRRRRGSSSGDRDGYTGKGWNGLTSVGSINSPPPVLGRDDVFEKRPSISSIPPNHPTQPTIEPYSNMLVQEPGSPPGSPASVELANLPLRRATVGTIGTVTSRRSMSGTTTHSLSPIPDPFATPIIPGTPRAVSEVGHNNAGSGSGSGSEAEFDGGGEGGGYDTPSDTSSTRHRASTTPALYTSSLTPASAKRASQHSRKPVPAYEELNLTSEEKEALGGARRANAREDHDTTDDDISQKSLSPLSVQSPLSLHGSPNVAANNVNNVNNNSNRNATNEDPTDHEHALALLKSLRSKSSGHMKSEAYVHYLIPDPPLAN